MSIGLGGFLAETFLVISVTTLFLLGSWSFFYKNTKKNDIIYIFLIIIVLILSIKALIGYIDEVNTHSFLESLKIEDVTSIEINKNMLSNKKKIISLLHKKKWVSNIHGEYGAHGYIEGSSLIIKLKNNTQRKFTILYNSKKKMILLNFRKGSYLIYIPRLYQNLKELNIDFVKKE